jgi:alpha-D-xyloside xylohydrolase
MTLSGVPWWTTDVGGFAVPRRFSAKSPKPEDREEWRELVTRWFQFATFCPLLRVHGQFPHREMWFFGADEGHRAFKTQLAFDRLRYRLLPYAYTLAAEVTRRHGSLMRPLVMDFAFDPEVLGIGDQFLFGPSLLVNPVTRPGATSRPVYLPRGRGFYDFWTGAFEAGGRRLEAPAPYESLPLYVKAGSILPLGPELQYTGEKPADPLTVWVYTGQDAAFDLYEDDGETYHYEQGAHATLPLRWDERSATLHLGGRAGEFPGMLRARDVRVVFVTPRSPVPHSPSPPRAQVVRYDGRPLSVSAPAP